MSQHSALASLTAQYTDSEEEAELEAESEGQTSSVEILGKTSVANSPQIDEPSPLPSPKVDLGLPSSQSSGSGTLVSYHDDLIDDDAVDDMHTDSPVDTEEEGRVKNLLPSDGSHAEEMETDQPVKNGVVEVVNVEDNAGGPPSKKKSLIPPEPPGKCAPELQEKFAKMLEKKLKGGLDMNLAIQRNKNFRNPSIYEKLIKYCDIDELGSNYPKNVFDPHEYHESSYYDELAKAQKELMEKRERERKERTKVDFVSGMVKKPTTAGDTETKRKSKWDQRGVMPPLLLPTFSQPTGVLPPFTSSVTGTKSTVINAFGNINRKQK